VLDWGPEIGADADMVTEAAPPARIEYLAALDALGLAACIDPYAIPALHFDPSQAQGTYWNWHQVISPGVRAMRPVVTRSPDTSGSSTLSDTELWSVASGSAAADTVLVEGAAGGSETFPPTPQAQVVVGSAYYDASPTAASLRMFELTEDREPYVERFWGRRCVGASGELQPVADISAV
jgi:hypothetical protein